MMTAWQNNFTGAFCVAVLFLLLSQSCTAQLQDPMYETIDRSIRDAARKQLESRDGGVYSKRGGEAPLLSDPATFERIEKFVQQNRRVYESGSMDEVKGKRQQSGTFAQYLRIGQLAETVGSTAAYSTYQMNAWRLWFARNPYLVIGGEVYGIQLIVYNDGSSSADPPNTVIALTEWMIFHDNVHILSTGVQGLNGVMQDVADQYGVPCINSGDYNASFRPPRNYSLYLLPQLQSTPVPCVQELISVGAKRFVQFNDQNGFLQNLYNPTVKAMGGTVVSIFNITEQMRFGGSARYQEVVDGIKALGEFDVLMGSTTEGNNAEATMLDFMQALHENRVNPKAVIVWNVASYPLYRTNGTWQVAGQLIGEAYTPSLNESDPVWGSSLIYDAAYRAAFGYPSGTNDAALAGAITMLVVGLNNSMVDLNDSDAILSALNSVNTSSIFGPLFFINNTCQRPMYCLQNTFPTASEINVVAPKSAAAYKAITYPAFVEFPKDFKFKSKSNRDRTIALAVGITVGIVVFLVVIAAVGYVILRVNYHTVFIAKKDATGDWQ